MVSFDDFKNNWLGKRVDYDGVYRFQCVDLIRQYFLDCFGLAGGGGVPSAINYWTTTPQAVLTKFYQVSNSEAQKGDIVILWGLPGNSDGHIGIATGNTTASQLEILEQNGSTGTGSGEGGDAIRTRWVSRSRVAGLLRPVAAPVSREKYQVVETYPGGKQVRLNKQPTYLWGMNYDFEYMKDHPVEKHDAGEVWTVTNKVHHIDGYDYYRREGQVDGFNVLDCDNYTPPPPQPYTPPAAPVEVPRVQYYDLVTTVAYFGNADDAKGDRNALGTIDKGTYVLLASDGGARKLTKNNTDLQTFWIRNVDNKPPYIPPAPTLPVDLPAPAVEVTDTSDNSTPATTPTLPETPAAADKPKPHYLWINEDMSSVRMKATNTATIPIRDLEGKYPVQYLPPRWEGEFKRYAPVGNIKYYVPAAFFDKGWMYGIPEGMLRPVQTYPDFNNNGVNDVPEYSGKFLDFIETNGTRIWQGAEKFLNSPAVRQAKTRVVASIDGFKRRNK